MRVTSFKDVETYLYTSVVMPLSQLRGIENIEFGSPMTGDNGEAWTITLGRTQAPYRNRQGPRRRAEQSRNWLVRLHQEGSDDIPVLAMYNIQTRDVTIYQHPFKRLNAMPLLGKMHEVFDKHRPFNKVKIEQFPPLPQFRREGNREQFVDAPLAPDYDEDYDGDYDDL